MSIFRLPQTVADATPEFQDAQGVREWLSHLPLANVPAAQHELLLQLEEFNRLTMKPAQRLAVLEELREVVAFVQIEQAKRFTSRAQPMSGPEEAVFEDTIELWRQMLTGYLRVLEACARGEPGPAALICQRSLACLGLAMFHHFRAFREVRALDWAGLHEIYRRAEVMGIENEPVKDYLHRDVHDTSPRIAYVRALLTGLANPNELSQRQLTFVAHLIERWGAKVQVVRERPPAEEGVPPYCFDLLSDRLPERGEPKGEVRWLDTTQLARSLRNRIALLRKGESPARLGLGEDCVQPSCEGLLVFLYRQWCQARPARISERRRVVDTAQAANDLAAIHYYVSGRVFRAPGEARELTKKQREEIATFGRVSTRDEDDYGLAQGFLLEDWRIEDESMQGLRLCRPAGNPGRRYATGQLVAVRTADARAFMLAQVRWLMQGAGGDLHAGLRLLPGPVTAVAVRATGLNVASENWTQALSLGAVAALSAPDSLVLASGWFKPRRVIELWQDAPQRVRLTGVLERGSDFERVAWEPLAD